MVTVTILFRRRRFFLRAEPDVLPAVAAQAQVGLLLVPPEALDGTQARAVLADLHARLRRDLLVGAGLHELADPETARVARGAERGQRVIGADHLVAIGDVGLRSEEQRAVVAQMLEEVARLAREHLDVLGGDAVGFAHRRFARVDEDDLAVVAPGDPGDIRGRQHLELALDLGRERLGDVARCRDADRRAGRSMLRLAEQIGGDHLHVGALVGDHQDLRRTGEEIDADAAEKLAFRFRDVRVAGAAKHVHGLDRLRADAHRGDGLHAAQHVDLVRAAEHHCGDGLGMRRALVRRRAGDDALHPRHACRDDAHVCRGDHRVAAAGHVAADALYRNVLVPELHAGQRLHFDVAQRRLLVLGELADLRLRELDVGDRGGRHLRHDVLQITGREPQARRRPFVELLRELAHRAIAAAAYVVDDGLYRLARFAVHFIGNARRNAALEIGGHGRSLQENYVPVPDL